MDVWEWLRAGAALIATLALLAGAAYLARRFNMLQPGMGNVERRLKVTESLMLDPRRRLVLVRLDGREHLLLLSPGGDQVVAAQDAKPAVQQVTQKGEAA